MHLFFNLGGLVGKAAAPCTSGITTDPTTAHAPAPNPTPTETHATASALPLASVTPSAPGQVPVTDNTSDGLSFKQKKYENLEDEEKEKVKSLVYILNRLRGHIVICVFAVSPPTRLSKF